MRTGKITPHNGLLGIPLGIFVKCHEEGLLRVFASLRGERKVCLEQQRDEDVCRWKGGSEWRGSQGLRE